MRKNLTHNAILGICYEMLEAFYKLIAMRSYCDVFQMADLELSLEQFSDSVSKN